MNIPDFRDTDLQLIKQMKTELSTITNNQSTSARSSRQIFSSVVSVLLVLALPVGAFYFYWRSSRDEKVREQAAITARLEKETATRKTINEFAARYGAVVDWREGLGKDGMFTRVFTSAVANLVVRADGHPVLFVASIRDVSKEASGYVIDFDAPVNLVYEMRLRLRSTEEQAQLASSHSKEEKNRYALVAQIESVEGIEEGLQHDEGMSELSLGTGKCLDFIPVGPYKGDYHDMISLSKALR